MSDSNKLYNELFNVLKYYCAYPVLCKAYLAKGSGRI